MSNRYQREIEEILDQVKDNAPADEVGAKRRQVKQERRPRSSNGRPRLSFSTGRLMLMGIGLLVASLLLVGIFPPLAAPAAWLGIILFIGAYVVYFTKPRARTEKMWRGESIQDPPSQTGLQRLWSWITRGG